MKQNSIILKRKNGIFIIRFQNITWIGNLTEDEDLKDGWFYSFKMVKNGKWSFRLEFLNGKIQTFLFENKEEAEKMHKFITQEVIKLNKGK